MPVIELDKGEKEVYKFEIKEPSFEILAVAMSTLVASGYSDLINTGKVIVDGCYKDPEEYKKLILDTKLYFSVCLQAHNVVEVFSGEFKKK